MRLPWVQVDQSAFGRAVELAAVLAITEAQALGHLVLLWRWALDLGPDDQPPLGVMEGRIAVVRLEAGSGWTGERGALFSALVDLGLVDGDTESLRVRGLDRYETAHEKQAKERARKAKWRADAAARRGQGADVPGTSAGQDADVRVASTPKMETQTQTQTQIEDPLASVPEGEGASAPPPVASGQVQALAQAWNDTPGLPQWRETPEPRAKAARARLRERPLEGEGGWRDVFARVAGSPFCRGSNDRGWRADPDWVLRPGTAAKVLEGKYDGPATGPPGTGAAPRRGAPVRAQDVDWTQEAGESPF